MKIFNIERLVVFRCEESLNIQGDNGERLDKVVSGRVIREKMSLFGMELMVRFRAEYCYPSIDMEDLRQKSALGIAKANVLEKCEDKVSDYYNKGS